MSKTILYVVVSLLNQLLAFAGINIAPEGVDTFVNVGLAIITALGIGYERWKKGDINFLGIRK